MIPSTLIRLPPQELQNMNIVILKGVSEKYGNLCAIGWVEDKPHDDSEAVTLHEPLYFVNTTLEGGAAITLSFIPTEHQVPMTSEFFTFTKVEIYEGITSIAVAYISMLEQARKYKPVYNTKWESLSSIYKQK